MWFKFLEFEKNKFFLYCENLFLKVITAKFKWLNSMDKFGITAGTIFNERKSGLKLYKL